MEAKDIKQMSVHILQDEEIHNLHKLPKVLFLHFITSHEQDMMISLHAHQVNDWFTNNVVIHHMIDKQKMFHNF
jgi:hypothetical protein